ncbi:MAG: Coenzyme F420 hydrogenase/dehydrogenase, beta subunit C-terminal domain [Deltaproteobacteria bacterium]|nr:Coenzyme F420 hydrogenase/dehydrogenase, beta subunit C-terminal domain [Deltaproteobacteria bacterium]
MNIPNPEGQGRLIARVINKGLCVRCGACVGLCPYFNYFDGKVVVMDLCPAGTFQCLQVCPRADYEGTSSFKGTSAGDIGECREILMARSTDEAIQKRSQYGGVVSALLIYALEKEVISSAVLTDAGDLFAPKGRIVHRRSEVLDCAGSRYSASGGLSAMNTALKKGYSRLGVVGLPCQMEALARMRLVQPDGEERADAVSLRIGLFCTWALDYPSLTAYLARQKVEGPVLKADIPPPPAETFKVQTQVGWRSFPLSDIRPMVQKGCFLCEDMTAETSDISVGTAEGRNGWNTVIARTETGSQLLKRAINEGWLETDDLPGASLDHLREAARNKRHRARQAEIDRSTQDE